MAWVQYKKPAVSVSSPSASTKNSPSSSSNAFTTTSSNNTTFSSVNINNNTSFCNTTNRNVNFLQQACQPITNSAQSPPQSLLMTSQYSTKENTYSKSLSTPAMRINPTSPYQPSAQQQLHHHQQQQQQQSTLSQRHPPQQQLQQQPQHPNITINNALQQQQQQLPTSQVSMQTASANSTASQMQGVLYNNNNNGQQPIPWTSQQSSYLPLTKTMQPTPSPAINAASAADTAKNWPHQLPHQGQQNFQNSTTYQQNAPVSQQQEQWPQNSTAATTYDNFYQQQLENNNMHPPQAQPHAAQQNSSTYFQQHPTPATQTNAVNFFDQSSNNNNNNNQSANADGWGDWDWNDNTAMSAQPTPEQVDTNTQALQSANYNNSLLVDSFNAQHNNDSWNWESKENEQHISNKEMPKVENSPKAATQNDHLQWNDQANDKEHHLQKLAWPTVPSNENQQQTTSVQNLPESGVVVAKPVQMDSSPPPPPPLEFSSTSENHNYNTNTAATATPNNIPNTVFVTQAKPVTLPSRQYASPPSGNTPVTENPPETALMPPQGFQNAEHSNVATTAIMPPLPIATTSVANLPPPASLPVASSKTGNPFKRSGVAQHHRATGFISSATGQESSAVFNMAPPPPADFANPGAVTALEPDNNELPLQENQEVLTPATTQKPLPAAASAVATQSPSLPPPPPNDERNQYLQTSHLSENSEEQQPEVDGLLPPPGLSRLVLGEPELEASQQRLVMGTEAHGNDNAVSQAAVMHLEERHADGEDTASENAISVTISSGQGVPSTSSTISSDRNLYMVPGESNNASNNQQRVVTGVELAEQREIEMDGENLEDEQFRQQQHQHSQSLHQHVHASLSAEARNEPPVEGADDIVAVAATSTSINVSHTTDQQQQVEPHHRSSSQLNKLKDSIPISSANDDDESDERLLNDRGMNQSTAGSSKSRTKYGNERLSNTTRRRDKRSSVDRYESDEYFNSEGEYSSEREERERRERDRRRNYREGSVRSERGANEDEDKRSRRQRAGNKRDKYYYEGEPRPRGGRDDRERDRDRGAERSNTDKRSQRQRGYDNDSRYETEESTRFDSRKDALRRNTRRHERDDQAPEYDDYNRRAAHRHSKRPVDNYESDRREHRRSDKHREPRYREDPRYDPREYEDYRKHSSRNARESDLEKDAGAVPSSRSGRMHHDPRHAAAMYGYPSGGYYDPYTAYYYQQMARTNPQAYAEWYKKFYGQAAAAVASGVPGSGAPAAPNTLHADTSLPTSGNDGRESVHSGRSSAHNDVKDRYTHAYITQANDYHRHYQQQQHLHQQHFHHQQQQQQQQQQHQQKHQMAYNQSLHSTMLDEETLNHNTSMYSGLGNLSFSRSNTNLSQIHGGYYVPATASSATGVYYARSDYAESRSGALSARDQEPIAQEPQRLTPCKFVTEHTVVNFASGILVTVKPKYTSSGSISNIVKLLKFKPNDETRKLFKVFPGPLVRGLTHKKTVIEFCQEQIRLGPLETTIYAKQLITNNAEKYRGSYTLMWNLLILLLKQNGMVVGTDIAELLLKNQQQFPYQTPATTANNSLKSKSDSNSSTEDLNANKEAVEQTKSSNPEPEELAEQNEKLEQAVDELEENSLSKSSSDVITLTEEEVTEKFRNYLLYGNVNEALEWATDNNLWGHALFLASKLDRRSHANVMMKFANKLSLNDPLQTLYQLMSGRCPSSVTCVQDEKWGDWRPHLSMILSNTSQKPELDRKAITSLGDSLFNRGDLYAAHFCYLMAQVGFGRYQEQATHETSLQQHLPKLVLLGSSHYKQFKDFAHNEAIIMTEIYEYACSLNDEKFSLIEFQPYKFLLATRLLDYGFHLKSLMYLEQIAVHIARDVSKYESSLINKVYELADRLKYYDPVLEKTMDDPQAGSDDNSGQNLTTQQIEEQQWLQNLRQLAAQQSQSDFNKIPTTSTVVQDSQQSQVHESAGYYNQQQQIDQQFMEINKQFSELNLQYQQQTTENVAQQQQPIYTTEQQHHQFDPYQQQQQQQLGPLPSFSTELPKPIANDFQQSAETQAAEALPNNNQQQPQYLQPELTQSSVDYAANYYDPSQYKTNETAANNFDNQHQANYDYWAQQQPKFNQTQEENARPTISMPKTKTYETDDENSAKSLQLQQSHAGNEANNNNNNRKQQHAQQIQQKGAKKEDAHKNQQHGNQNSGWFGGIWNKFSLKPKNQMILPDDKNPSIVWDPEKKKWVNTDGDEDEQEALKPPPKMSDLMPQTQQTQPQPQLQPQPQQQLFHLTQPQQQVQTNQLPSFMDPQQQQQQQPQIQQFVTNSLPQSAPSPNPLQQQQNLNQNQLQAPGPAKTPTLQSNMFKMQRNRTLKNAYVDVFNPSGAPVNKATENILAPALPPAAVPQSGFFIPGGSQSTLGAEQQYQQQPLQQDTPQFYNPQQFTSGTGY